MEIKHIDVLVGGQYGSEGKGAVAGALVQRYDYDLLIRVAGSNAGHTTIGQDGQPHALRSIPAAGVMNHDAKLYIAPGSEVDLQVLRDDLETFRQAGAPVEGRLYIHPEATLIETQHYIDEGAAVGDFGKHGSTRKGVGAARAARIMRQAHRISDIQRDVEKLGATVGSPPDSSYAMIEGTQGYLLGSHAGCYPYCTSSDCRAIDFLAMAHVNYTTAMAWVVFRSYPIRIAGNSGPLEREITWDQVGVKPEFTTVTKKMRRVGMWEPGRVAEAVQANRIGGLRPAVAMTFMDYMSPDPDVQRKTAEAMLGEASGLLEYVGNGPGSGFWT